MSNEVSILLRAKDGFSGVFHKMDSGIKTMMSAVAGYFSAGAVMGAIKEFSRALTEIKHSSDQLGISTTAFQVLAESAQKSGLNVESLQRGFAALKDAQGQAAAGGDNPITKALQGLNIEIKDFIALSPDKAFELLSQKMVQAGGDVVQISAIFDLIGKQAGYKFNAVMREVGSKGIAELAAGMEAQGKLISEAMINTMALVERAIIETKQKLTAGVAWQLQSAAKFSGKDWAAIAVTGIAGYIVALARVQEEVTKENQLQAAGAKIEEDRRAKAAADSQKAAEALAKKTAATKAEWQRLVDVDKAQKELDSTIREGKLSGADPDEKKAILVQEAMAVADRISALMGVKNAESIILELRNEQAQLANQIAEIDRQAADRNVKKAQEAAQSYLGTRLQLAQLMLAAGEEAGAGAGQQMQALRAQTVRDFVTEQKAKIATHMTARHERAVIQALEARAGKNWENIGKLKPAEQDLVKGAKRKADAELEAWAKGVQAEVEQRRAQKLIDAIEKAQKAMSEAHIRKLEEVRILLDKNLKAQR
jgi:hypothetical protein